VHGQLRVFLLHAHESLSQVSAFGGDNDSDGGDLWAIDWDSKDMQWEQDTKASEQVKAVLSLAQLHEAS
jgi:hypothetical protein